MNTEYGAYLPSQHPELFAVVIQPRANLEEDPDLPGVVAFADTEAEQSHDLSVEVDKFATARGLGLVVIRSSYDNAAKLVEMDIWRYRDDEVPVTRIRPYLRRGSPVFRQALVERGLGLVRMRAELTESRKDINPDTLPVFIASAGVARHVLPEGAQPYFRVEGVVVYSRLYIFNTATFEHVLPELQPVTAQ